MSTFDEKRQIIYCDICNTLIDLGIRPHLDGYGYLVSALMLVVFNPSELKPITGSLYPKIAEELCVGDSKKVEHSIRTAINKAFNDGDIDILHEYFGQNIGTSTGKVTNLSFIAIVSERIRLRYDIVSADFAVERHCNKFD